MTEVKLIRKTSKTETPRALVEAHPGHQRLKFQEIEHIFEERLVANGGLMMYHGCVPIIGLLLVFILNISI